MPTFFHSLFQSLQDCPTLTRAEARSLAAAVDARRRREAAQQERRKTGRPNRAQRRQRARNKAKEDAADLRYIFEGRRTHAWRQLLEGRQRAVAARARRRLLAAV